VYPLTVALVIGTKPLGDEIRPVLQAFGCRVVLDQNDVGDWNEFLGKLDRLRPNVVLYDVARLQEGMEEPLKRIRAARMPARGAVGERRVHAGMCGAAPSVRDGTGILQASPRKGLQPAMPRAGAPCPGSCARNRSSRWRYFRRESFRREPVSWEHMALLLSRFPQRWSSAKAGSGSERQSHCWYLSGQQERVSASRARIFAGWSNPVESALLLYSVEPAVDEAGSVLSVQWRQRNRYHPSRPDLHERFQQAFL